MTLCTFNGLRINVVQPFIEVPLRWYERLLHPFRKTKFIPNKACPPKDQVFMTRTDIYCREETYLEIRKSVPRSSAKDSKS